MANAGDVDLDSAGNRAIAREIAERSVVLLDAGSALPLTGEGRPAPRRVAVVGPCADDALHVHGLLRLPQPRAAALPRARARHRGADRCSTRCARSCPDAEVVHEPGCPVQGDDRSGFAAAVAAARGADVCVAAVGDLAGLFGRGTSGEGCDAEDLRLPGVQADLLDELLATGTPVVVVVVSGRPYALGDVAGRAAGLVQAFMPGEEGGAAIAGVLTGRISPSGKLPVQIPRHPGGQPGHLPAAAARRRQHGDQQPRPDPVVPVRPRPLVHHLRGRRPADQLHRGAHRRRVHRHRRRPQHRDQDGRGGRAAVPARRPRPGDPAGPPARRASPGCGSTPESPSTSASGCTPTGPRSPGSTSCGSSSRETSTSWSEPRSTELPCRGRVRLTGPLRRVGSTDGRERRLVTPAELGPAPRSAGA